MRAAFRPQSLLPPGVANTRWGHSLRDGAAVVAEDLGPEGRNLFAETTDYTILEVYTTGGKPKRTDTSMTGRVKWKVSNALRLKNPPA